MRNINFNFNHNNLSNRELNDCNFDDIPEINHK
jgi:hypothetical protein